MEPLYTIIGTVKKGAGRGKDFGFPTANVSLQETIPPGVYASQILLENKSYNAVTFIGSAVTYGDAEYKSESTIMDFDQDIYGKELRVTLLKKIRDNLKFESEEELITYMNNDMLSARSFFDNIS